MADNKNRSIMIAAVAIVAILIIAAAIVLSGALNPAPATDNPEISITSPLNGATINGTSVTITVEVSNFTIVNKLGQANVEGEGHIHYFKDVAVPTTPGVPAVTGAGTYAVNTSTTHTWTNVSAGSHTFSVLLVNNDHTPLEPAIYKTITVTVQSTSTAINAGSAPSEITTYGADWPLANKDYSNTRFTAGSTIDSGNIDTLGFAWSYNITGIGSFGGAASNPLILGNDVYFQDLRGNVVNLDKVTGEVKWVKTYDNATIVGPNGPAVGYGNVYVAKDVYTIAAINRTTGTEVWSNKLSNITTTGIDIQPIVYDNTVFVSTVPGAGDVFYAPGGMGIIYALNATTGAIEWSFNTVKDGDLWGNPTVNSGGGSWYPPAVDTETGYMYWAVANPAPFAGAPGWPSGSSYDNALYTNSVLKLDHNNGDLQWYSQLNPHDIYDHDLQISPILATGDILGNVQDVSIVSGKMGNVYCLNRTTGAVQWKTPVGDHMNDYLDPINENTTVLPGVLGGVETEMAYANGIIYVPVVNLPTEFTPTGVNFSSIDFSMGTGSLVALDIKYGHILWQADFPSMCLGAATVVNDLVWTATFDGTIYAFGANNGTLMFKWKAPAGINAWPAVSGDTIIWPCGVSGQPVLVALKLGGSPLTPSVSISSPTDGSIVFGSNVTVTADALNFEIVAPAGQPNQPNQGHLHFFIDVLPPTTPGVPAVTANGTWALNTTGTYTWTGVAPGVHMLSVELVNNDHTPLVPAVYMIINVTVLAAPPPTTIFLMAQGLAFNVTTINVSAGSVVTMQFFNNDAGVPHNFALYASASSTTPIFAGAIVNGVTTITYVFTAPSQPGTYQFRCDVHPLQMVGSFVVT